MQIKYMLINILIMILTIYLLKKNNKLLKFTGAYAGFIFGIILYYCVVPLAIMFLMNRYISEPKYYSLDRFVYQSEELNFIYANLLTFSTVIFLTIGYKLGRRYKIKIKSKRSDMIHKKSFKDDILLYDKVVKIFELLGISTLVIGGLSFSIILISLGGIKNALSIAETIRQFNSGLDQYIGANRALFYVPARLITVTPFIFYFLIINRNKKLDKIIFTISFIGAILFYLFNAGRGPLIIFILCFTYVILRKRMKKVWIKLFILGILGLPLLDVLDKVSYYFRDGIWTPIQVDYLLYIHQFSHPFKLILNVKELVDIYGFRYGFDAIGDVLSLLPYVNFEASYINTSEFIKGIDWINIGGVPNDFITYTYIQLGLIGNITISFLVGWVLSKIDLIISKMPEGRTRDLLSVILATNLFGVVAAADLRPIIQSNVILVVIIGGLILSNKYLNKKKLVNILRVKKIGGNI